MKTLSIRLSDVAVREVEVLQRMSTSGGWFEQHSINRIINQAIADSIAMRTAELSLEERTQIEHYLVHGEGTLPEYGYHSPKHII